MTTPCPENNPKPIGPHEAAALLGVSRQRLYQLMQRPDFPRPWVVLAIGKVWRAADIAAWDAQRKREAGGATRVTPP